MKKLEFTIAAGIGDNIVLRMALDSVKHNYDEIRISHNKDIVNIHRNGDPNYFKFLNDLGSLLFSEKPYIFDHNIYPIIYTHRTYINLNIKIKKPNLNYLLCKGSPLNIGEYIVLTTKIRTLPKATFLNLAQKLWVVLNTLSNKYKIVVMGEREMDGDITADTYSIYNDIMSNLSNDKIIDLTIPILGKDAPTLNKIQQDCLIMENAKFVIANGIGGNVWMSAAVANTIGFRTDNEEITDIVINPEFENIFITKNFDHFIDKIKTYQ